jgi:hypothetical protein
MDSITKPTAMSYWKLFISNWNVCRIVRIVAGISFLLYGIQLNEIPVILFGGAWLAAGLFSMQCCSTSVCSTPYKQVDHTKEATSFEEIK